MNNLNKVQSGLRINDLIHLSLRIFKIHPGRTILTILGMSIGIGAVFFLVSLGYGLQYILIGKMVSTEDSLLSLEVFYPGESNLVFSEKDLEDIKVFPEVKEISEVADLTGDVKFQNFSANVLIKIIKPNYFRLSGSVIDQGEGLNEDRSVIVSNIALQLLNLPADKSSLGKEVYLTVSVLDREGKTTDVVLDKPFKISGIIVDEFAEPTVYLDHKWLKDKVLFFNRIFVKANNIDNVSLLKDKFLNRGLLISAKLDLVRQARQIMNIITWVLGVFGVVALLVAGIGMFNVMLTSFLERIFEIGIMKSIGATSKDVRNLFLMESFLISILGGIGGVLFGLLGGEFINLGLKILARRLGGEPVSLFIFPIQFIFFILGISILVGILAGFWPAKRAAKLSAREAFIVK